jgi:2-dehydro-3-deoxygluconokinase
MPEIVTVGETMIRMVPTSTGALRFVDSFHKRTGGAESNFAVGLSRLGHSVGWISRLGKDEFGQQIITLIRGEGVDISQVKFCSDLPTGIVFNEFRGQGTARNLYYRRNSAASSLSPQDIDLEYLSTAKLLHLTGITPALSESCKEMVFFVLEEARNREISISFDPNIRFKLWGSDTACNTLLKMIPRVNLLLLTEEEAQLLLRIEGHQEQAAAFHELGPDLVVIRREDGVFASDGHNGEWIPGFKVDKIVDPLGAGDAFDAGFVAGWLEGMDLQQSARYGNAAGAITVSNPGNTEAFPTRSEIADLLENESSPLR